MKFDTKIIKQAYKNIEEDIILLRNKTRNKRQLKHLQKQAIKNIKYSCMPLEDLILIEKYKKIVLEPIKPKDKIEVKQLELCEVI